MMGPYTNACRPTKAAATQVEVGSGQDEQQHDAPVALQSSNYKVTQLTTHAGSVMRFSAGL